ncbi:uncharacterized protein LOC132719290 isoform X2 [Ruditapes philippinarum]|uniref:uncharacterized protein LOC132719290 isoform X2 n=1 Tax=Ruditapes philippinarum TaxID=129788 RepID=UPI00295B4BFF|nr:uncharacterized protein LOC132719290 isoform X2 [Ruditapes philippinarum]
MADRDLQERILKFLNSKSKKKEAAAKIIQALRVPKKSLNNQLYKLLREGRVVKCEESPPVWALPGSGAVSSLPVATRRSRRASGDIISNKKKDDADLKYKILEYLNGRSKPSKSLEIAKGTGRSRASEVNTTLYGMLKEGLIKKISEKPPTWALVTEVKPQYSQGAEGIGFGASAENNQSGNYFSQGQGIPEFQERELFKTEPLFGSETFSGCAHLKEENEAGCSNIKNEQSEGFFPAEDDMDVSSQGSSEINERYEDNNISEGTGNYGDLDDDAVECDGDTFDKQEQDAEQRMDMLNFDGKLSAIKTENSGGMIGCTGNSGTGLVNENVCAKKHAWNVVRNQNDESLEDDHEYDSIKKPKTFRDVFNLDDPISEDSNNSFKSGQDIDSELPSEHDVTASQAVKSLTSCKSESSISEYTENQDTPKLSASSSEVDTPVQKNVQGSWSTPQILDIALDLSEISGSPVVQASQDSKSDDLNDSPEQETMVNTEHDLEAKDEISQVEMDEDTFGDQLTDDVQNDMKSDDLDMEDCDKVLKVLQELKAIAQFVLKRKTDIPPEHLDEVLQKCLSLKYVSGSSKLWKITDEGVTYISKKTGKNNIQKKFEQNIQTEKKLKPNFKGPPPSPMALLNKEGADLSGNNGVGNDLRQNIRPSCETLTSHSPNSLFKPPPVRNGNSSTRTENSGPQSLMSIKFDSNPLDRSDKRNLSNQGPFSQEIPQPLMSLQFEPNLINTTKLIPSQKQESDKSSYMEINFQTACKPQLTLSQTSMRTTPVTQELTKRDIPDKYADYPNRSASMQCLKTKTQSQSSDRSSSSRNQSKSAFNKGPPPSPLDILSKSLKKTEISPPSSFKDKISVSQSSGLFSTTSYTMSNKTLTQPIENKSMFSLGQFASQSRSSDSKIEHSVNQSSLMQTGSLFGSENRQTVFKKSDQMMLQSSTQSLEGKPKSKGPPPPPAVKLGLQLPQSTPALVPKQAQNFPKPNLGLVLNTESFNALNKNPVSALMEYAQSRKMVATVEVLNRKGSSHKPTFEMAAFVGKRKFPSVTCHNKKDGRKEACDIAMRQLVAEGQFQAENAASNAGSIPPVPAANMTHFDTVAALTHRGFTALVSQITAESFAGRKVIAGLVMKRSADDVGVLVSLGTGNRCITGQQLSLQGNTVNDSHAEIITRRGFLRFLYKRLMEFDPNRPHPMLEKSPRGKLQIRPNISFHLYISTAPCGDGALFSPRDVESAKAPLDTRIRPPHEPTFSSNVQGLLRTKVEGGEGTIPVEPGFKVQTFDGIQRGERLRTMSCTDKVCRWNVVGLQGALLSHFLEPIYLDSLTLGLLYDHGHLCRAVCCRVGRGNRDVNSELPPGFKLNHPWLGRVTACDPPREVQKTKALSINWCFGDNAPEVTDGTQGLCFTSIEKGFFSRCSKHNLFTSFKSLCEKFGRQDLLSVNSYNEAKMAAQDFVSAKETMLRRFKENGFGKWVSKPVEEEMFGYDEKN